MLTDWRNRPVFHLYHLFWSAVDWLYPPYCAGCEKPGSRWCGDCDSQVQTLATNLCPICGIPQKGTEVCASCRRNPPAFRALRSWAVYSGPVRKAVHRLKYRGDLGLAEPLAERMRAVLLAQKWEVQLITNVPLGYQRKQERGYNQARELAWPIATALRLPYASQALNRVRETRTQVGLSAEERMANVDGAFSADPAKVNGKSILLVDDVATTGSTLNACARALRNAGAKEVYALSLARAVRLADHSSEVSLEGSA